VVDRLRGVEDEALVYERADDRESIVVCLNFGSNPQPVPLPAHLAEGRVLISTHRDRAGVRGELVLRPDEGVVLLAPG